MTGTSNENVMHPPVRTSQADDEANKKHRRKTSRGFRGGKNRNRSKPYSQKNPRQMFVFFFTL